MDPRRPPVPPAAVAAVVDLALVALFVVIGRASHREDAAGFLGTYWPFLVGLAAGWAAARAWRRPFGVLRAGVPAWVGTALVGVLLRALVGQGVQPSFVVVTAIVNGAFLLGWRVLLIALDRSSTRTESLTPLGRLLGRR